MKIQVQPFEFTNKNYHLGHLFVDIMKSRPHAICQIDAATGESETNGSVLSRSIQFARCLHRYGVKPGDILALGGENHLDLHIPFYAALMNGMPIAGVDPYYEYDDIKIHFSVCEPKIAFCQKERIKDYLKALKELKLDTKVICFDDGEYSMKRFISEYDDQTDEKEFEPAIFDLENIYACILATGGTIGNSKLAAFKHKVWLTKLIELRDVYKPLTRRTNDDNNLFLNISPVQWISAFRNTLVIPLLHMIKLQTSGPRSPEHITDVINKYKPVAVVTTTVLLNTLLEEAKNCDFTSFHFIVTVGSTLYHDTYNELRKRMRRDSHVIETYGITEALGHILMPIPGLPFGCCGNGKFTFQQLKLVDTKTGEEITKPNITGEMLTKGPRFSEYYKEPKLTASAITDDGWLRTRDLLYRDEHDNYHFVERAMLMVNGKVSSPIIETIIRSHPGVREVCVLVERPVNPIACVVRRPGVSVTAQEIKDLVASKLPESQRLHGGVIFMEKLPMTSAGKIARAKLHYYVYNNPWE